MGEKSAEARPGRKTPAIASSSPAGPGRRSAVTAIWVSAGLVALTVAVYAPVRHFSFVSWDDPLYVSENPVVSRGLTAEGIAWALTSPGRYYWHPVTWLSHMADVQLFGLQAGAHHVTNLFLYAAVTLLLFWMLRKTTGRTVPSAIVAALFAVHPLHVESVAWIAERKDVLSGVFWMLTLGVYADYVRTRTRGRFAAVIVCFTLGLMSKPTVVTLPFVLLLLDIWPLGRMEVGRAPARAGRPREPDRSASVPQLLVEKIPLFALSIAGSLATFAAQSQVGAVLGFDTVALGERLSNAVASTVGYLGMALWPSGLAAFYPFRPITGRWVICCLGILAGLSYAVIRARHHRPYLLVGWLWYLVTLLPVIGLVQVGSQAMADRFTFLPLVGLLVAAVWGASDAAARFRVGRAVALASTLVVVVTYGAVARVQVGHWRDGETLWRRAAEAVRANDLAHANLGLVLAAQGRTDEALAQFDEAIRIVEAPATAPGARRWAPPPEYAILLHDHAGRLLVRQQRWKEAIAHFRELVRLRPGAADAHFVLGQALLAHDQVAEAVDELRAAIGLEPGRAEFHGDFASAVYRAGDRASAMAELEEAIRLNPADRAAAKWHFNLAAMLNEGGRTADAIRELNAALAINPGYAQAREALAALREPGR